MYYNIIERGDFIEDKLIFSYLNWLLVVFASLIFISSVINDLKEMF